MLRRLIRTMAERWGVVLAITIVLASIAALRALSTPLEVFPEFVTPQVTIQTEAPGLAAEQVEQLVTRAVEAVVGGTPGLETTRSESLAGLSVVTVSFGEDESPARARQGVAERLAELSGRLPLGVAAPTMSPLTSSTMDLLKVGLVSTRLDDFALRDLAERALKPRLLAVPGVARVTIFGGALRQIQIVADPARLREFDLTLADIVEAARRALVTRGGGFVDTSQQRIVIQLASGANRPEALGAALVARRQGISLKLSDVATVGYGPAIRVGDALIQGRRGLLLTMSSQYGANTLETTQAIEAVLAELTPDLTARGVELFGALHRPATFIEIALGNLESALVWGGVLILLVLLAFLRDWRPALISFATIPLSLLLTAALLSWFGWRLDTMVLGGFAVASGVLVDDAIIDVENVLRRLRQHGRAVSRSTRLDILAEASVEIRVAVVFGTAVAVAVFLPVIAMSGVQGRFLAPLGLAFVVSVSVSLLVAATVTPALCSLTLRAGAARHEPRWLSPVARLQAGGIRLVQRLFWPSMVLLSVVLIAAVLVAVSLPSDFLPAFREGHFVVQLTSQQPGTSLDAMLAVGQRISDQMLALPSIATVEQQVGRAERAEDTWGTERSELHVEMRPGTTIDQEAVERDLRAIVAGYPGFRSEVLTFLGDRISETLTGETAPIVVGLFGDDLDEIERAAVRVGRLASGIRGAVDIQVKRASGAPEISLALDHARLARVGLDAERVLAAVDTAYAGTVVGQVYEGAQAIDVTVLAPPAWRERLESLNRLPIALPSGQLIELAQLAEVRLGEGRSLIRHERGRRSVAVTLNAEGRDAASVVADLKAQVAASGRLPHGVTLEFGGVAEAGQRARRRFLLHGLLAGLAVVGTMAIGFTNRRHVWFVLLNLPFALTGSIAAIWCSGVGLSLGALVGVVTVFGISARNAIMLLSHYEQLVAAGAVWDQATALRGAHERLVPVLMTAAVTCMGLLPLVLGLGRPGYELEGPLAVAVLGGLVSSTVLNLVVLPEFARRFAWRPVGPTA